MEIVYRRAPRRSAVDAVEAAMQLLLAAWLLMLDSQHDDLVRVLFVMMVLLAAPLIVLEIKEQRSAPKIDETLGSNVERRCRERPLSTISSVVLAVALVIWLSQVA